MPNLKCILLVEDDPSDEELIMTGLADDNLANEVVAVHDGSEALDYLNYRGKFAGRTDGHPAIVLLDLKLPKVSGLEVLKQMKTDEKLKCIPVVILTSSREDQDILKGYALGANSYVVKPVSFHTFIDAIKLIGVYWAIISEPPTVDGWKNNIGFLR
ncbi:MAG: response regulator [Thermodesulfovibrionales bacterium]|jgi:CheY-like chemotaxis protein